LRKFCWPSHPSGTIGGLATISGIHSPGNSPGIETFLSDLSYTGGSSQVIWDSPQPGLSVRKPDGKGKSGPKPFVVKPLSIKPPPPPEAPAAEPANNDVQSVAANFSIPDAALAELS